jgi:ribosomal protein L40E
VRQLREISHPRTGRREDEIRYDAMKSLLKEALSQRGIAWSDFEQAPASREPDEVLYCPRCHALYLEGFSECRDCGNHPLRPC